ncbi:NADP-dependent oxidoreductase [Nakamurella silvestris]|nr:NADP-dependent oxidoreductase [Nakamurella silvestris]
MAIHSRQFLLAARPVGEPKPSDFRLETVELPSPAPGQLLVRNIVMSVDPYMRGRMSDTPSYAPSWLLGEPARGGAIGEVIEAGTPTDLGVPPIAPGTLVLHDAGWREHALVEAHQVTVIDPAPGTSLSYYLGTLGMPGLTAYTGLFHIADFRPGDTVFISGAAGAVGGVAGQLAKLRGASRVIGSAGSAEKVRFLTETLGFDAAFDYHAGPVGEQLRAAAPEGIDLFFDNVGGDHLEAAISSFRIGGRAALCGSISGYNATAPRPGPANISLLTGKRAMLKGFIVSDHWNLRQEFLDTAVPAVQDGRIQVPETVFDGLESAPHAFIGLLRGQNTGKMIVRLAAAGS